MLCGAIIETNKQTNSDSHSSLLKTLRDKWSVKEYYYSLWMAIQINKEILIAKKQSETTLSTTLNQPWIALQIP